jgi:hypothetical protein
MDYPTIVLFLGIALGVLGLLAAGGLWMLRRWGLLLTIIVSVLNILLAAPWIAVESQATGKLLAGVTAAGFALVLVLVMQPSSRRAFAATSWAERTVPNRALVIGAVLVIVVLLLVEVLVFGLGWGLGS